MEYTYIGPLCPHGGRIVHGIAYCGICTGTGNSVEGFTAFLESFYDICGQAAWKNNFQAVPYEDRRNHAFLDLLENLGKLLTANNPYAMARTIARRSIVDLSRKAVYWREIPISQLADHQDGQPDPDFAPFPKANRFWKPRHLRHLERILDDAFARLDQKTKQAMILKLWCGFYVECGPLTYKAIGKSLDLTPDRVRNGFKQGIENLRLHLKAAGFGASHPHQQKSEKKLFYFPTFGPLNST